MHSEGHCFSRAEVRGNFEDSHPFDRFVIEGMREKWAAKLPLRSAYLL
jgi:hypothetical protein